MKSSAHGVGTSKAEVTNISSHGIWLLVGDEELFLSYQDFPWFLDRPVKAIINVEEPSSGHFYWPELDVDLSIEIIRDPAKYPLKSK